MNHVIIGTAGHVDHGKTALVKSLSGQDTDRLKEEKARGISIDLGFAHMPLTDTLDAAIVDVPGHERFLKNMLAGVGGIDLALLVVAADEGVMPQTIEHVAMLNLYGIKFGVIAITKVDKVEAEWLELIEEEVNRLIADTFLATAPILRVSAFTGQGLSELKATLARVSDNVEERDADGAFRLWIDRAFTIKGYGVVVTGSVLSGKVAVGQLLQLEPAGLTVKVRGIECHGKDLSQTVAGQRAAINLSGVDTDQVSRGMLLSSPERSYVSRIWDVSVDWQQAVKSGTRVRLHLGTGEWIGRVRRPRGTPDEIVRLSFEQALPGGAGERGIVRLYSPPKLVAGITLLSPVLRPTASLVRLAKAMTETDMATFLAEIVASSDQPLTIGKIRRACGYVADHLCQAILEDLQKRVEILRLGESYFSVKQANRLAAKLVERLAQVHNTLPSAAGESREAVRQYLGMEEKWFDHMMLVWQKEGLCITTGSVVALPSHATSHRDWLVESIDKLDKALVNQPLCHLDMDKLTQVLALQSSVTKQMQENLLRAGELVRLGESIVYRKTLQNNVRLIQHYVQENITATAAQLRDVMQISRKLAIPVLEYCDMNKYTVREGDLRRLGPRSPA